MIKSKRKIEEQISKKTNSDLVETVREAKRHPNWMDLAGLLSRPKRKMVNINLDQIDKISNDKDIVIVPGKVLSMGNVSKKIKLFAMNFSGSAVEKLKAMKVDFGHILNEIKTNPEAKGVKVIKNESN